MMGLLLVWIYLVYASLASQLPIRGAAAVDQLDIIHILGPLLSPNAEIYLPGSEGYANGTIRWSSLDQPDIAVVVKVATEGDVQQIIHYANTRNIPFLAKGGGHGTNTYLGTARHGIYIWTRGMSSIKLNKGGLTATIQAGAESGEVTATLWALGKQVSATACDCVGFMAPILGGGHGWLQGRFGLVTDNLISARVVLASGEIVVVSDTQHSDLFWAIRGAGHNFGVVTSVEFRVFDRKAEEDKWAFEEYIFSQDKLEGIFDVANSLLPDGDFKPPVELTHYSHIERRPAVDPENPVIVFWVIWQGLYIPEKYTLPLRNLAPLNISTGIVETVGLNLLAGAAYDTPNCGNGANTMLFPVATVKYNTTALRTAFELYSAFPVWLNNSFILLEGYSTTAVHAIPAERTAYPDRFNNLLLAPLMLYLPGSGGSEDEMVSIAEGIRGALVEGSGRPLHAYVNYARGNETLEAIYGYEDWRIKRLQRLKKSYDPHGRFNFYNPLT